MFFDAKLLGIRQNGRFAKCWLAATNPKAFRAYVKRHDLEKINVISVCDQIYDEINKNIMNSKRRIPLYLAAQLVFGTVCIFQQQVYFLYEKTNNLLCTHVVTIQATRALKRPSEQKSQIKKKKQKLTKSAKSRPELGKNFQELLEEEIEKSLEIIPPELPNLSSNDFLIRDINWAKVDDQDQEMFGEMSAKEKQDFVDLIEGKKTMAELCHEEKEGETEIGQSQSHSGKQPLVKNLHEIVESRQAKFNKQRKDALVGNSASPPDLNVPVLRDNPCKADTVPIAINIPREIETSPVQAQTINIDPISKINEPIIQNDVLAPPDPTHMGMEVLPPVDEQNISLNNASGNALPSAELPLVEAHVGQTNLLQSGANLEDLSKALVAEMYRPKKKKKKSCLKIDACIKINTEDFLKQYDFEDTLRCFSPRDDIVPYFKITFKKPDKLLALSCSRVNAKCLLQNFKAGTNLKQMEVDTSVLDDIVDAGTVEVDEIFPTITKKSTKTQNTSLQIPNTKPNETTTCRNLESEQIVQQIEQPLPPFEIIVPDINDRIQEHNNEVALPPALQSDLISNFREQQNKQEATKIVGETPNKSREKIRENWGKEAVLRKLLYLWQNKVQQIHMGHICEGADRKGAAYAFFSVIELSAHNYVKLSKNGETNEISHIEMGERLSGQLTSKLN